MNCQNCQSELSSNSRFCEICGNTVGAQTQSSAPSHVMEELTYSPPEDFELDLESSNYYHSEFDEDGVRFVTWFDANTGEYEKLSYVGDMLMKFAPPDGFVFDPESLRFYTSGFDEVGVEWVIWFDSVTGEYEEISYPPEQPLSEPIAEQKPEPLLFQPQTNIPQGFTLDENSGLYYKTVPGKDSKTGVFGKWYTWFYPETGEYNQHFHTD